MIERDFHGYKMHDAIHEVEMIIGDIRKRNVTETVRFITGIGIIQISISELLNSYHIGFTYQLGNQGVLIATIE